MWFRSGFGQDGKIAVEICGIKLAVFRSTWTNGRFQSMAVDGDRCFYTALKLSSCARAFYSSWHADAPQKTSRSAALCLCVSVAYHVPAMAAVHRPDYGIDAPGVVRNLFLVGIIGISAWALTLLGARSGQFAIPKPILVITGME